VEKTHQKTKTTRKKLSKKEILMADISNPKIILAKISFFGSCRERKL
jgi:hypothetical protein